MSKEKVEGLVEKYDKELNRYFNLAKQSIDFIKNKLTFNGELILSEIETMSLLDILNNIVEIKNV